MNEPAPGVRPRDAATWAMVGALTVVTIFGMVWAFSSLGAATTNAPADVPAKAPANAPTSSATPEPATGPAPEPELAREPAPEPAPGASPELAPGPAIAPAPTVPTPAVAVPPALIDLNRATKEQLETLPGIGPALAQRILDDRAARGPFRSVDDLDRVPGIGVKTIDKFRAKVFAAP
jgi:competence protein ComEA